jgi:hypothetical protein
MDDHEFKCMPMRFILRSDYFIGRSTMCLLLKYMHVVPTFVSTLNVTATTFSNNLPSGGGNTSGNGIMQSGSNQKWLH